MIGYDGSNATFNPIYLNGITSHDIKLALRWSLGGFDGAPAAAPGFPAYAPPPPAYNPPPAPSYSPPPPLMRKG